MDTLLQDLRLAVRSLWRRPAFTAVAGLSVALGIGFTATVFSAANALLIRPVAGVAAPDRVVEVGRTNRGQGFDTFSYPELQDLAEGVDPLAAVAGWSLQELSWGTEDGGERIHGMRVSGSYFDVLGARPAVGRLFGSEEDGRAGPAVVVLSHRFWRDRLGGTPDIVGSTLDINRMPFTVIGVAPAGFRGHMPMVRVDAWTPIARSELANPNFDPGSYDNRRSSWLSVIGRLAEGETVGRADASAKAVMAGLAEAYPTNQQRGAEVVALGPVPGAGRSYVAGFLGILFGLVTLILLIAASNVAGMLVVRAAGREREIAIRLAVGSGRGRLLRQLTTESMVLFLVGGGLGTGLAFTGAGLASRFRPPGPESITLDVSADATVLLFALGLALVTGLVFGMVPALNASRPDLVPALKSEGRAGRREGRLQRGFAAGQVALSLVLLVAAGLFLRALQRAGDVDPGFVPDGVRVAAIDLALDGYTEDDGRTLQLRLVRGLQSMPGFDAAGIGLDLPLDLSSHGTLAWPENYDAADGRGLGVDFNVISPGYFDALRIPVQRGRSFEEADGPEAAPVVVVSRAMVEAAWPDVDPIGQRLRFGGSEAPLRTVVGVAADVKNQFLGEVVEPMVYLPSAQYYRSSGHVVARGPGVTPRALRAAILEADPRLAVGEAQDMAAIAGLGLLPQRIAAWLSTAMGAVALFLAGLGVYGVIAYSVVRRRREIGVRMAVGATRSSILGLVLHSGLRLALPGIVIGGILALAAGRLVRSLIFGVSPTDPVAFGVVAAALLVAVAVASGVPALRAARQDPMASLRSE